MPKLNDETAQAVNESASGFEPIDDGVYHVRLRDVTIGQGPAGDYWSWEFEVVDPPNLGRRLWQNTSQSPKALWKMKETFEAFGVETSTDTDDLCGKVVRAVVSQRTIQAGARQGQLTNQVDKLMPPADDWEDVNKSESEDMF